MYKYLFVIVFSVASLNACEFVNGVTIQDPKVSKLFATAEALFSDNEIARRTIEDLYVQYLCLLGNKTPMKTTPLNDGGIITTLESLIASKR